MGKLEKSGVEYLNKLFSQILVSLIVFFYSAGTLMLAQGWAYFVADFAWTAIAAAVIAAKNPEVLNQRNVPYKHNTQPWDKILLFLYLAVDSFVAPSVAGMELGRSGNGGIDLAVFLPGLLVFSVGNMIAICAMLRNVFFEITSRIQDDRDQTVVSCGPYRVIRHPGYLSFILNAVSLPLMTGSRNAWACAAAVTAIIILRTKFEDGMLISRLPGYRDYAQSVRWRLVPLVW